MERAVIVLRVFLVGCLLAAGWCGHAWYERHRAELPSVTVKVDPGSLVSWPRTVRPGPKASAAAKPRSTPAPRQDEALAPRAEAPIYWAPGMPYLSPPI